MVEKPDRGICYDLKIRLTLGPFFSKQVLHTVYYLYISLIIIIC